MSQHEPLVRDWLRGFMALISSNISPEETRLRLNALAARLATNFPSHAFNEQSFEAVARCLKFFPSYAELFEPLDAWVRDNPIETAVTFDPEGPTDEDMAWVRNWERHASNNWGKNIPVRPDVALRAELGRLRQYRKGAFEHLIATNDRARFIAQRNSWMPNKRAASDIPSEVRRGPVMDDDL